MTTQTAPTRQDPDAWMDVRHRIRAERPDLVRRAASRYPGLTPVDGVPLLARRGWILDQPVDLADVQTVLDVDAPPAVVNGTGPAGDAALPARPEGPAYERYSDAVREIATPAVFENRTTYRLVDVDEDLAVLRFGLGRYFDGIDVGEAVAHEFALGGADGRTPLRDAIGDPTDPARRPVTFATTTLTLRWDGRRATFPLHFRDPAKVGHAGGMWTVVPVGIFQPANDAPARLRGDFDLWHGIVREFAEELAGGSEDYGPDPDYDRWPFARTLDQARRNGDLRVHVLGLGVDPLTFATDLLTVAVVDAPLYDRLFTDAPAVNAEGTVAGGFSLDDDTVDRLVHREVMQAAGAATLALTHQHRRTLLA